MNLSILVCAAMSLRKSGRNSGWASEISIEARAEFLRPFGDAGERRLHEKDRVWLDEALTGIHGGSRGFPLERSLCGRSELECTGYPGNDTVAQQDWHSERLGHPFNPARRVNRVANHGDLALSRMADAAEDHRAEVNSDADAQGHVELALERWAASSYRSQHSEPSAHGVPARRLRRLVAGAEDRQDAVPDVLVDKAVVVEHRLGGRREIAVQHVHDVMRQALLAEGREVPNIREEDREIDFFSLACASSLCFIEVEDNDVLCVVEETANDNISLDASLTRESRAFIPAAPGCYLLFDLAQRRNIGKAVQDLNTTRRAAAVAAALMKVWDPMADGEVKERLTSGDVFVISWK